MKKIYLLIFAIALCSCGIKKSVQHVPNIDYYNQSIPKPVKHSPSLLTYKKNYLYKNQNNNLWEMYVEGDPLQRGLIMGSLGDSLLKRQENVFFDKIREIVPSKFKQGLLRQFLKYYNRKLYLNVTDEYQTEIYGLSQYASDSLEYIAPKYLRTLYLHGAHDIGHALSDLSLVGCTSFAVWGENSADGSLLIGRNLDFYAGDEFAENKVVYFVKPDKGHPYVSVSWPGFIGVVSGMNLAGLTVTINSGKSDLPLAAKTPISILTREILQYASTIDEAIAIAKKRQVFVSESIMVGSASDKKAVIIEVSPDNFGVYEVKNTSKLICANHFQSDAYAENKNNKKQLAESHSKYRFDRMEELLEENEKITPQIAAAILRNTNGLNNKRLGYGNEKALNQLLAHHGIIFQPEQRLVWVSANPYQLGEFVCYDLNKVFKKDSLTTTSLSEFSRTIPKDPFLETVAFQDYEKFKVERKKIDLAIANNETVSDAAIDAFQMLNPDFWEVYFIAGKYYQQRKNYAKAILNFEIALTKEITTLPDEKEVRKQLEKVKKRQ